MHFPYEDRLINYRPSDRSSTQKLRHHDGPMSAPRDNVQTFVRESKQGQSRTSPSSLPRLTVDGGRRPGRRHQVGKPPCSSVPTFGCSPVAEPGVDRLAAWLQGLGGASDACHPWYGAPSLGFRIDRPLPTVEPPLDPTSTIVGLAPRQPHSVVFGVVRAHLSGVAPDVRMAPEGAPRGDSFGINSLPDQRASTSRRHSTCRR